MLPVIAIFIVNAIGLLLKYFDLDRYLIFIGFRFHISLVIPFLFIFFRRDYIKIFKEYLFHPRDRKYLLSALFIFVPVLILISSLSLLHSLEIGDPDYFYELGMTSILDFPVYLIWNFPQLLMLALFLVVFTHNRSYKQPLIFFILVSLFVFEFIPVKKGQIAIIDAGTFLFACAVFSLFLSKIRNIYLFAAAVFSITWSNVLMFGSNSKVLINILLARTYNQWDGFFEVNKVYYSYIMIIHFAIAFILFFIPFMLISRQSNKSSLMEYQMENLNK